MLISIKRHLWVGLSSQSILQSSHRNMAQTKFWGNSGLHPRLQHSWRAERCMVKSDVSRIFAGACELAGTAVVSWLITSHSCSFQGKKAAWASLQAPSRSRTTGSIRSLWRQTQNSIDFKSQETNLFTSSSTQLSGEHKQSERNKGVKRVIVCAVTLQQWYSQPPHWHLANFHIQPYWGERKEVCW